MISALALAAIFAGAMLPLALIAIREATGRRKAEVNAATEGARVTALAAQLSDTTNRLNEEKARADRIEDAMAHVAAGPVTGAHQRLLEALAAARAARGDGTRDVPADAAAAEPRAGDTDLLQPGE
jgi:hypothetical protein